MTSLVDRLRVNSTYRDENYKCTASPQILTQAADTIEALCEALREYLDAEEIDDPAIRMAELAACRTIARAALERVS